MQIRRLRYRHLTRSVHRQGHFVGVPVGEKIECQSYQQRNRHALLTAHGLSGNHEQGGKGSHEHQCLHCIHRKLPYCF